MIEKGNQRVKRNQPVVAIDGPAGSGKSTVAAILAKKLGMLLVDTGALYRAVALIAQERGINWDQAEQLGRLASDLDLGFDHSTSGIPRLLIDGKDRADEIRSQDISMGASLVSRHPQVREALLGLQRKLGQKGGVVLEGRDIGTVVFPDAEVKIFLFASVDRRAERRFLELRNKGIEVDLLRIKKEVQQRDEQDQNRSLAPLRPAQDAVMVDTTDMNIDEVVERLSRLVEEHQKGF